MTTGVETSLSWTTHSDDSDDDAAVAVEMVPPSSLLNAPPRSQMRTQRMNSAPLQRTRPILPSPLSTGYSSVWYSPSSARQNRMTSIVQSSYAMLDTEKKNAQQHDTSPLLPIEPMVSSLQKSLEILKKTRSIAPTITALTKITDSTHGESKRDQEQHNYQHQQRHQQQDQHQQEDHQQQQEDHHQQPEEQSQAQAPPLIMIIIYLSAFSILGAGLRVFLGRLFGNECSNEETPWLHSVVIGLNLCVTSNGEIVQPQPGGALFSDLPANMLGCFLMGLLQPTQDLRLLSNLPVAFLGDKHWFQSCSVIHLGLRTGFCGSLTTLASWNTQMVAMIDGTMMGDGGGGGGTSQFFSAMFGYIVGLEVALASFALGQKVAIWMHRYANPHLAREEDVLMFAYSKADTISDEPKAQNKALPDYERRYLASLLPREQHAWAKQNIAALEDLERWKISTDEYRTTFDMDDELLVALHQIERKILVDDEIVLGHDLLQLAQTHDWDIASLQKFANEVNGKFNNSPAADDNEESRTSMVVQNLWKAIPVVLAVGLLVAYGALDWKSKNQQVSDFSREMWLSLLFSPLGTIVRWKLASLNGKLSSRSWAWFPLGTFSANLGASVISALMHSLLTDSSIQMDLFTFQILSAIKTGFAGSMSTVSTFVAEGSMLQRSFPHHAKAYYYLVGTLTATCVAGLVFYSPLVRSST